MIARSGRPRKYAGGKRGATPGGGEGNVRSMQADVDGLSYQLKWDAQDERGNVPSNQWVQVQSDSFHRYST